MTACPHCLTGHPPSSLSSHIESCTEREVPCTHSRRGCPWKGRSALLTSEHIPSCPFEAIKGFFTINDNRFAQLSGDNLLLRQRVETLEHTIKTMRREHDAMRAALGPWYRPESVLNLHSPDAPRRPLSSVPTTQMHEPHAYAEEGSADPLASYFPPADDIPMDFASQQRALRRASTDYSNHASTSTTSAAVAPLDLGSSLEGALVGLRESMVTLAASVDSLGRRSEIALTNESMRLNEEVMSLRAALHGLRMQVRCFGTSPKSAKSSFKRTGPRRHARQELADHWADK